MRLISRFFKRKATGRVIFSFDNAREAQEFLERLLRLSIQQQLSDYRYNLVQQEGRWTVQSVSVGGGL